MSILFYCCSIVVYKCIVLCIFYYLYFIFCALYPPIIFAIVIETLFSKFTAYLGGRFLCDTLLYIAVLAAAIIFVAIEKLTMKRRNVQSVIYNSFIFFPTFLSNLKTVLPISSKRTYARRCAPNAVADSNPCENLRFAKFLFVFL